MTTPKAPKHLTAESKRLWKAIHSDYDLDDPARLVLTATLESRDRREQARAEIAKTGATQTDRFGQCPAQGALEQGPEGRRQSQAATHMGT